MRVVYVRGPGLSLASVQVLGITPPKTSCPLSVKILAPVQVQYWRGDPERWLPGRAGPETGQGWSSSVMGPS